MMNDNLLKINLKCDLCIIGGGLSGSFAALAAARHGAKVILIQDRPMLGGNASSEIRMWVRGAGGVNRESGLLMELEERNIHYNPTLVPSLFDAVLYDMVQENENIRILLNASCLDAETEGERIRSVRAWQSTTYTWITVEAKLFADCSGDSVLATLTGAQFRKGRESSKEFGESLAPEKADDCTMGMSLIVAGRETHEPVPFTPPTFANCYPDDSCFAVRSEDKGEFTYTRKHDVGTSKDNLWWVELGGDRDSLHDSDAVRKELMSCIYGVWDHIKNQGDHGKENWDLEWVGALPGKRETRRYVGDVMMTQGDLLAEGKFEDEIAYGGWPMDDHNPLGMRGNNAPSVVIPLEKPYGIPLRALYSKNIENLLFAGRNISVSHIALSSTRVMGTCSLLGQAMGTAAAMAIKYDCSPRTVYQHHLEEVQKLLQDDGVFLPHIPRKFSALTKECGMNISEEERAVLLNGVERPRTSGNENGIYQKVGESLVMNFGSAKKLGTLRLQFDPDYLDRTSISPNKKMRVFTQKLHTGLDFRPVKTAASIVKGFAVYADEKELFRTEDNYYSLVKIPLHVTALNIRIEWLSTHGAETVHLFSVDMIE